ncbi:MAG: putative toxin-antitoxin system toxin component, PIN family [Oscillospiraceae bacterium]|nr:putative toxin-antitoxin system toxin component, PIN family [Oscillospiraceae bacterium]
MRIMLDTNVIISAFVLSSQPLTKMIDVISENHTIVLSTYVIAELKRVVREKFPDKYSLVENFLQRLDFELVYTPEVIDKSKFPEIRDKKDLPILVSAIIENVDILISGDKDFIAVNVERPEILTSKSFVDKYC